MTQWGTGCEGSARKRQEPQAHSQRQKAGLGEGRELVAPNVWRGRHSGHLSLHPSPRLGRGLWRTSLGTPPPGPLEGAPRQVGRPRSKGDSPLGGPQGCIRPLVGGSLLPWHPMPSTAVHQMPLPNLGQAAVTNSTHMLLELQAPVHGGPSLPVPFSTF